MKSREGGGKRKYAWGWLRKECSECTPPTSPKSLMFTVSGFLTETNKWKVNFIEMTCYGNGREAHQLSGVGGGSPNLQCLPISLV